MDFNNNQPIYRQIIDYCYDRILDHAWAPGGKIPSVRELAMLLSVNTHTVIKALDVLQAEGIIAPRRGMGFFLAEDAHERVMTSRRNEFFDSTLTVLFDDMQRLGINIDQVVEHYNKHKR